MKKVYVLMSLCLAVLSACGQKKTETQSSSSSTEKMEERKEESSSLEENEGLYASTLDKLKADTSEGHAQFYSFYDIDKNGTVELLTGHYTSGSYYLAAIYYLNQGVSTYLAQSRVASSGGSREGATVYRDGTVFYARWMSTSPDARGYLYQLKPDNTGLDVVKEAEFQIAGVDANAENSADSVFGLASKEALDLDSLTWKDIKSYRFSTSPDAEAGSTNQSMDLAAIQKGDFSSVEGTWRNGRGDSLIFDKNGLVSDRGLKVGNQFKMTDSYLQGGVTDGGAGAGILFVPSGVAVSLSVDNQTISDTSDKSKDRILIGQNVSADYPTAFYYKE